MAEDVVIVLRAVDKATGVFKKTTVAQQTFNKSTKDLRKTTQGAATAAQQLAAGLKAVGITSTSSAAPGIRLTKEQFRQAEQMARKFGVTLRDTNAVMGISAVRARQMNRAFTRTTAALGFISPTAATAVAQLESMFQISGKMALVLGGLAVGAIALGTALIGSTRAAINFESSFRGIEKTVVGTEEEFAQLAQTNRDLAISLGTSVNAINEIGKAAGQLGISIGDLAQFEQIIVELAAASDIGSKEAALAFGGLIATLDLTIEKFDALTDQIVVLGNTFSTGEADIVAYMNRIAGAGAVIGLTEVELANIAATFASLRIPVEAGGTAIQKVFLAIQKAAVVGGEELETFASILGVSTREFQRLVTEDPFEAFSQFIDTLVREGPRAQLVLAELGLGNERTRRAFLTAAAAGDRLTEVTLKGNEANEEATGRTEEFAKELDTTAGQMRVAVAALNELGISLGDNFLPILTDAAQAAVALAEALKFVGDVSSNVIDLVFPSRETEKESVSGSPLVDALAKGAKDLLISGGGIFEAKIVKIDPDLIKLADGISRVSGAFKDTNSSRAAFGAGLGALVFDVDAVTASANDARDALFGMFKEPTIEGARAKLVTLGLEKELSNLLLSQEPLNEAEAARADFLKSTMIPASRAIEKQIQRESDILQQKILIEQGGLQSQEDLAKSAFEAANDINLLNAGLENTPSAAPVLDESWLSLKRLVATADLATKRDFELIIDVLGEEEANAQLQDLLNFGFEISAQDYIINIQVRGAEFAAAKLQALVNAGNQLAIDAVKFGALTAPPGELNAIADQIARLKFTLSEDIPDLVGNFPNISTGGGGAGAAAKAAAKEIDPLKDGIITLAEALEFGFTAATAATAELEFALGKLDERAFRTRVELIKLDRAEAKRNIQIEIGVARAEREIELRQEVNQLIIDQAVAIDELTSAAADTGLIEFLGTFQFSVNELGEELQRAEESFTQFLTRLSQAATEAVQTQFDQLFNKPTREEAQLGLQIAVAERDLSLLIRSGASDELIAAKEEEVRQIQNLLNVRRAEEAVIQAQALVADQTLLTQHEQFLQATLLIGLIATESALVDDLNFRLALEVLALDSSRNAVDAFRDALIVARDVVAENTLGPGPGQSRGLAGTAGSAATFNFEVNVNAESIQEIRKQINEELDDQLNAAGLAGSNAGTGTFIP